jgi:hypothetical protein
VNVTNGLGQVYACTLPKGKQLWGATVWRSDLPCLLVWFILRVNVSTCVIRIFVYVCLSSRKNGQVSTNADKYRQRGTIPYSVYTCCYQYLRTVLWPLYDARLKTFIAIQTDCSVILQHVLIRLTTFALSW